MTKVFNFALRFVGFLVLLVIVYVGLGVAYIPTFVCTLFISLWFWIGLMASSLLVVVAFSYSESSKYSPANLLKFRLMSIRASLAVALLLEISAFAAGDYKVTSILPSGDPLQGTHYIEAAVAIGIWLYGSKPSDNEQK